MAEVCSLLLSHGADPVALNCHAKSALDVAATQELRERLAFEYKGHCLLEACRQADPQKVKKLAIQDAVNFKHPHSHDTPLHCAVSSPFPKRKAVVEILHRKGANLNDKNKEFLTPLHVAAEKSHYDVMEILLKHGAKVNALDGVGQTSLHRSARDGNVQACRVLLGFGADPTIVSLQGKVISLKINGLSLNELTAHLPKC